MSNPNIIYIASISPRSGTNYLSRLVAKHPSCAPLPNSEDHLLQKSTPLRLFAKRVYNHWSDDWSIKKENTSNDVLGALGEGLVGFLQSQSKRDDARPVDDEEPIVVTKTPHAKNARFFPRIFHDGFLVVLIRDGRAVAESRMRTFDESFEEAVRGWRQGARSVIRHINKHGWSSEWHRVVKYEQVYKSPAEELRRIFDAAGLDPSSYPYSTLEEVAVVGSSTYGQEEDSVTWEPKQDDGTFNPLERFQDWRDEKHERYEWLAGTEHRELRYSSKELTTSANTARQYLRDVRHTPGVAKKIIQKKVRDFVFSYVLK